MKSICLNVSFKEKTGLSTETYSKNNAGHWPTWRKMFTIPMLHLAACSLNAFRWERLLKGVIFAFRFSRVKREAVGKLPALWHTQKTQPNESFLSGADYFPLLWSCGCMSCYPYMFFSSAINPDIQNGSPKERLIALPQSFELSSNQSTQTWVTSLHEIEKVSFYRSVPWSQLQQETRHLWTVRAMPATVAFSALFLAHCTSISNILYHLHFNHPVLLFPQTCLSLLEHGW